MIDARKHATTFSAVPRMQNPQISLIQRGDELVREAKMTDGVYFTRLVSCEMTLDEFRHSQKQFYFAVNYYSQPIAALFARLSDPSLRMQLLGNLMDEHGSINLEKCHSSTFKAFLNSIGTDLKHTEPESAVLAFNLALMGICCHEKPEVAAACLGIIELSFSQISTFIARAVIERSWVSKDKLSHYSLHASLDIDHAQALFDISERMEHSSRDAIERGMRLGIYIFDQLYTGLSRS